MSPLAQEHLARTAENRGVFKTGGISDQDTARPRLLGLSSRGQSAARERCQVDVLRGEPTLGYTWCQRACCAA